MRINTIRVQSLIFWKFFTIGPSLHNWMVVHFNDDMGLNFNWCKSSIWGSKVLFLTNGARFEKHYRMCFLCPEKCLEILVFLLLLQSAYMWKFYNSLQWLLKQLYFLDLNFWIILLKSVSFAVTEVWYLILEKYVLILNTQPEIWEDK